MLRNNLALVVNIFWFWFYNWEKGTNWRWCTRRQETCKSTSTCL